MMMIDVVCSVKHTREIYLIPILDRRSDLHPWSMVELDLSSTTDLRFMISAMGHFCLAFINHIAVSNF